MHQTSETTIDGAVREINKSFGRTVCDRKNTIYNLAERGNNATNSHFVALRDAIDAGVVRPGGRVLFGISGSGLTVGTALYTFDDLPERLRNPGTRGERAGPDRGGARGDHPARPDRERGDHPPRSRGPPRFVGDDPRGCGALPRGVGPTSRKSG